MEQSTAERPARHRKIKLTPGEKPKAPICSNATTNRSHTRVSQKLYSLLGAGLDVIKSERMPNGDPFKPESVEVAVRAGLAQALSMYGISWHRISSTLSRSAQTLQEGVATHQVRVAGGAYINCRVHNAITRNIHLIERYRDIGALPSGVAELESIPHEVPTEDLSAHIETYRETRTGPASFKEQCNMVRYIRYRIQQEETTKQEWNTIKEDIAWHVHVMNVDPKLWYPDIKVADARRISSKYTTSGLRRPAKLIANVAI